MLLQLLAFYERATQFLKRLQFTIFACLRNALGPAPQNYYLLADERVLPTTMTLPDQINQSTFLYDIQNHRIVSAANPETEGRFRRLPYVAINVQHPTMGAWDLSDWIGELRANPVPLRPSVKQLISLWSLTTNTYVPYDNQVEVQVTESDGTESTQRLV